MDLHALQKHVHLFRSQGMPDELIHDRLRHAGWDSEHINTCLAITHIAVQRSRLWILIPILTALGLLLAGFIYYFYFPGDYHVTLLGDTNAPRGIQYGSWAALARPDYYESVKASLITEKTPFIVADLSSMQLSVYQNGSSTLSVPIKAKGKKGSWWETPVGLYKIQSREESHFSSFGKVYQPYSLAFQGNFFIHGWPHYPDGTPVASTYSGGCIRLSDEDAAKVYQLAKVGMPVLVYERAENDNVSSFNIREPQISAPSYLVADQLSGTSFYAKNPGVEGDIGSIANLLLALVTVEHLNIEQRATVPDGLPATSRHRLTPGTSYTILDLLTLMLREDSREAAVSIGDALGKARAISLIGDKLHALGMDHTRIRWGADGLTGTGTPEDLFLLAKHVSENRSFLWKLAVGTAQFGAYDAPSFTDLAPVPIRQFPGLQGGLIASSSSSENPDRPINMLEEPSTTTPGSFIGVFTVPFASSSRPVAIILMNATDIIGDIEEALRTAAFFALIPKQ